jgi:hypothetical protein
LAPRRRSKPANAPADSSIPETEEPPSGGPPSFHWWNLQETTTGRDQPTTTTGLLDTTQGSPGSRCRCTTFIPAHCPFAYRRLQRACAARKRVLFTHAPSLLEQLLAAEVAHTLPTLIEAFGRLDLLIIDELGYLPMDAQRATLLFQLISHLYTRTAVIVTSNVPFEGWGRIFGGDDMIASAILDRLLHFSHVFLIAGPSYRMKGKLDRPGEEARPLS